MDSCLRIGFAEKDAPLTGTGCGSRLGEPSSKASCCCCSKTASYEWFSGTTSSLDILGEPKRCRLPVSKRLRSVDCRVRSRCKPDYHRTLTSTVTGFMHASITTKAGRKQARMRRTTTQVSEVVQRPLHLCCSVSDCIQRR